ncbi:MAG: protein-L-isoaspartate(D-aspartate) O-methyltransferase [Pseudomonadales bacterium]|nr:protein-L-isoaspartate(D-aspartate) O-methyltransferase [Pseudomonadales bacterium]
MTIATTSFRIRRVQRCRHERPRRAEAGRGWRFLLSLTSLVLAPVVVAGAEEARAIERARMVAEIRTMITQTRGQTGVARLSAHVEAAMLAVPRHLFLDDPDDPSAYANHPLPIGLGQTISQPYMVALMTELAAPGPLDRVLEIGTGSGYQAAVLAELAARVETIEILEPLAIEARERLAAAGYENVRVHAGDGWHGVPEQGPYDAIVVTAVAEALPPPLLEQLRPGGRIVIPIGPAFGAHDLMLYSKDAAGAVSERWILPVRFVPLTRSED